MTEIPTNEKILRKQINDYKKALKKFILTSRFSNGTHDENTDFRRRNPTIGCIYCAPEPISCQIPIDSVLFVLEMNNDTNKIMGLGMVPNHPRCDNKFNVYEARYYNKFVYIGKNRIDRTDMTEEEEAIMIILDNLCFKGNGHMKRGQGLKLFPVKTQYHLSMGEPKLDLVYFITNMFKQRLQKKENEYEKEKI
jgi:hypothetical protein